jgi:predicted DNA-binding transcriptional regulator AlpA
MPNPSNIEKQRRVSRALQNVERAVQPVLPDTGLMTWQDIEPFVPFSRRSLSVYLKEGTFPPGTRVSNKLCWRAEAIRRWIDETLPFQWEQAA